MNNIYFYATGIGQIGMVENGEAITHLYLPNVKPPQDLAVNETPLLYRAGQQIQRYFAGSGKDFNLPLAPAGTDFMQKVWQSLRAIPYGETRSYGEIAQNVGNKKAYRAVGMANHNNPIAIIIPCHRVIGANGKLVGYAGGLDTKAYLLELEKHYSELAPDSI